jgi:hypothetical protein
MLRGTETARKGQLLMCRGFVGMMPCHLAVHCYHVPVRCQRIQKMVRCLCTSLVTSVDETTQAAPKQACLNRAMFFFIVDRLSSRTKVVSSDVHSFKVSCNFPELKQIDTTIEEFAFTTVHFWHLRFKSDKVVQIGSYAEAP